MILGFGFRVSGFGCRVSGVGCRFKVSSLCFLLLVSFLGKSPKPKGDI